MSGTDKHGQRRRNMPSVFSTMRAMTGGGMMLREITKQNYGKPYCGGWAKSDIFGVLIYYSMKNLMFYLFTVVLLMSCSKDKDDGRATVEVTLSYYYNKVQGYKPDVNASVYLFKDKGQEYESKYIDYATGGLVIKGTETRVFPEFSVKTDVKGVATFIDVPYGKYILVVSSKGRYVYSKKKITIDREFIKESKNFGYLHEFEDQGEA